MLSLLLANIFFSGYQWIPSLVALISIFVSFFVKDLMSYLPVLLFGIYMSWIYLRYFQKRLETGLKGDPSVEFSFSSFFPEFLRPILDPIASIFHRLLCGRSERADARGQTLDTSPLPGSDSIEANRRRERGQRALEQRLAEKLAAVRSSEGTSLDAADKVWVLYTKSLCSLWIPGNAPPCDFLKDRKNEEHAFTFSSPCITLVFIFSNWEYRSIALHFFPKVPL